jgi:hypothetical protein
VLGSLSFIWKIKLNGVRSTLIFCDSKKTVSQLN